MVLKGFNILEFQKFYLIYFWVWFLIPKYKEVSKNSEF